MKYTVAILPRVEKALVRLPARDRERILSVLRGLRSDPRPKSVLKLVTRKGWRLRVGAYRIVYEIEDRAGSVTVLDLGHRREVYR